MITEFPATTTMTPEQALRRALRDNLQDVLVCGFDDAGVPVVPRQPAGQPRSQTVRSHRAVCQGLTKRTSQYIMTTQPKRM